MDGRVKGLLDEIEATIDGASCGWPNRLALNEVQRLVCLLQMEVSDGDARDGLSSLQSWCTVLYSARKHHGYARGIENVRGFIRSDLGRVQACLARLD